MFSKTLVANNISSELGPQKLLMIRDLKVMFTTRSVSNSKWLSNSLVSQVMKICSIFSMFLLTLGVFLSLYLKSNWLIAANTKKHIKRQRYQFQWTSVSAPMLAMPHLKDSLLRSRYNSKYTHTHIYNFQN